MVRAMDLTPWTS